jgi:flavin reductase (DIM6/NTAB) family NADH-FMN oxidoreductase RutF/nitroreductase
MKNKSTLLNIVLAVVILVLVFQLSTNNKKVSDSEPSPKVEQAAKPSDTEHLGHEKKSMGPQPLVMPMPAFVIGTYDAQGKPNIMTAAWAGIANSEPVSIAVSVRPSRETYKNIKETGYFTVNVPSEAYAAHMDYAGNVSGRDEDKFEVLGLTPVKGEFVNAPYISEFPIVLECKVTDSINLGSHVQFIGEILDVKVDLAVLDADGHVDAEKVRPVVFDHRYYYGLGKRLGRPFDMYKSLKENNMKAVSVADDRTNNDVLTTIFERKSVRNYTSQQVSKEQLTLLVKAGMAAPTAVDKRPWAFVAVTDRTMLNQLADVLPYAQMLRTATSAIVVCGDLSKALEGDAQAYWVQDCSAATQNILLAAEGIGLGAVWTGVHPIKDREDLVRKAINAPSHIVPLNVIAVGYPTGQDKPKDKWDETILHWEKW